VLWHVLVLRGRIKRGESGVAKFEESLTQA